MIPQCPELYVAYLAVLYAGHGFCPITPDTPVQRVRFILQDVNAALVLCLPQDYKRLNQELKDFRCLTVCLADLTQADRQSTPDVLRSPSRHPSDVAYVMYTSGSTGKPKGVPVSHKSATQSLLAHDEHIPVFKRFLQFASPTFDVSIFEIFFPWYRGATLVSCAREAMLQDLPGVINDLDVDAVELTPSVATTLLRTRLAVPKLKLLMTIGEMLTQHVVQEFGGSENRQGLLYAMYGPTEAAIHCTIVPKMSANNSAKNIGRPLATVTALILSTTGSPTDAQVVPIGKVGELAVAGQLAGGYLNRAEQTAAAFVHSSEYGIVYRTGDKARLRPDRTIEMLGRIADGQVKLRGQRIELGEIESAASQTHGVSLAAVVVIESSLVVFCACSSDQVTSSQVRDQCRAWLPRHMLPDDVVILQCDMPILPSGKIDRRKLQQMYAQSPAVDTSPYVADVIVHNDLLQSLSDTLQAEVDPRRSLRSQGVDSLKAIVLTSKLREKYPTLTAYMLLESSSVTHLAKLVDAVPREASSSSLSSHRSRSAPLDRPTDLRALVQYDKWPSHARHEVVEVFACSETQIAMLAETARKSTLNMNQIILKCAAGVSTVAVIEAFHALSERCDMLRSTFRETEDSRFPFVRIVHRRANFHGSSSLSQSLTITPDASERTVSISIHHALYDGWSWDALMHDLNMILAKRTIPLQPTFEDFRRAQQTQHALYAQEDLAHWTGTLQDVKLNAFPHLLSTKVADAGRVEHTFQSAVTLASLDQMAQDLETSRPSIVQTALCILLSLYTGSRDVLTGLVTSGRNIPLQDIERVVGPCLTTLPFVARLTTTSTLKQSAIDIYEHQLKALKHSQVSLAQIRAELRDTTQEPLFDVLYVWQESPLSKVSRDAAVVVQETHDQLDYALVLEAIPTESGLTFRFNFDGSRISNTHADLFAQQLNYTLEQIIRDSAQTLNELWRSCPTSLLSVSNQHAIPCSTQHDITGTIAKLAAEDAHRTAIEFVSDYQTSSGVLVKNTVSYGDLHNRSQRIANQLLLDFKLGKDDVVCIWAQKSPEVYIHLCAIMAAGIAFLCIDPKVPIARAQEIVRQAQCSLVLADKTTAPYSNELEPARVVAIHRDTFTGHEEAKTSVIGSDHTDLAYAVFTSGSTGVPKGVLVTRGNLYSNIVALEELYPHDDGSRLLQSCSLSFDVSVFEIFWTWHCGMTLCAASNDVLFRDINGFISSMAISHLSMTPSTAALLDRRRLDCVEFLVCAGEPMSAKVFDEWVDHGLWQGYGPSETTNICNVRGQGSKRNMINNVGKFFSNTSAFVCSRLTPTQRQARLDLSVFRPLPIGAVGEIWIGGAQVGRGYTDPDLTARSWLEHPELGRLYRSGDIGRLLADGTLVVLGREDDQVKIRGQRVELSEINSQILDLGIVFDAVTMIVQDDTGRDSLISFWVRNGRDDHTRSTIDMIFEHLHSVLPPYMIPEMLVPVDAIPLTRQGKIDRRTLVGVLHALTSKDRSCLTGSTRSGAASETFSALERTIADVVSAISGIPVSGLEPHASLYSYGIDSIRAIALARQLQTSSGYDVVVSTILKYFTIGRLASALQADKPSTVPELDLPKVVAQSCNQLGEHARRRLERRGLTVIAVYPCTPLQQAMLLSSSDDNTSYANHLVYQVYRRPEIIKTVWHSMIQRHQILRTVFAQTEDSEYPFLQLVLADWPLPWFDCSVPVNSEIPDPFTHPPYRLRCEEAADGFKLHLYIHHALHDAGTLDLLQREIEAHVLGDQLPAAVPFSRYLVNAHRQDQAASDEFWSSTLADVRPCRLAETCAPNNRISTRYGVVSLDARLTLGLVIESTRNSAISMLSLLQASMIRLLASCLDTPNVCFGTVYSGRNIDLVDVHQTVGPCFNTLPVCMDMLTNRTNVDLCHASQQFNTNVLPFQSTSLRELQRRYGPDGSSLFDVVLLVQADEHVLNNKVWRLESEAGVMNFPFIFEVQPRSASNELLVRLHSTIAGADTVRALLTTFVDGLRYTMNHMRHRVTDDLHLSTPNSRIPYTNGHAGEEQAYETLSTTDTISRAVIEAISDLRRDRPHPIAPDVSIHKLGLDSINAAQLAAKLKRWGYKTSMAEILARPKVKDIIDSCRASIAQPRTTNGTHGHFDFRAFERRHRDKIVQRLNIPDSDVEMVLPCTATQSGILSEHILSGGTLYQNSITYRLGPSVDLLKLKTCWMDTQAQHIMLRTSFMDVQDKARPYAMLVWKASKISLPWVELGSPPGKAEIHLMQDCESTNTLRPCWQVEIYSTAEGQYMKLSMLHALYDAASIHCILCEVAARYRGETIARPPRVLDALDIILEGNSLKASSQQFWQSISSQLQPTHFPNLHVCKGAQGNMLIGKRLLTVSLDDLHKRCAELETTLWSSCQLVWAQLLGAYTGQDCVTFGTILSGRVFEGEDLTDVRFPCINTLPVCVNLGNSSEQLRQDIQNYNAELQKQPHVSFAAIRQHLKIEDVLFDTLLVLQAYKAANDQDSFWQIDSESASAEFAVSLEIIPKGNDVELNLTYNSATLPAEQGSVVLAQFESRLLRYLTLSRHSKRDHILQAIVPAKCAVIPSQVACLHDMISRRTQETPENIALEFIHDLCESQVRRETWSYRSLLLRANQIAHLLIRHGAKNGALIGISFNKCPEAAFALLGVLIAGCAYVAIDPDAPLVRKQFILTDAKCCILLTMSDLEHATPFENLLVLELDLVANFEELPTHVPQLDRQVTGEDTCYCLYTSGTTGTPKGCLISHKSAVQAMLSFSRIFNGHWSMTSKWLQFAAYHFDVSVLEHFWSWSVGMCVTVVPRDLLFEDLPATIARLCITHIDLTPSLASMLTPELVPSLREGVFVVGGEQVRQEIIEIWGDVGCLYNFYGPSEVTIGCTVHPRVAKSVKPINIGRQWDNVSTYVMRPGTEEPVLVGEVGELCLGGVLVGQGYLNRPDLTDRKFVLVDQYNDRIYRTGDLVRMLWDQSFEFLGRIDDQVKLRGQRLEIGEIDTTALHSDDCLKGATTLVIKQGTQDREQLVTFLTRMTIGNRAQAQLVVEISPDAAELTSRAREFLSKRLPAYMIPSQIYMVNFLPLTANNKIDTKSLRALHDNFTRTYASVRRGSRHNDTVPAESLKRVTDIIASYLDTDCAAVDPEATLFELGIDSVSVVGLSRAFKNSAVTSANVTLLMKHSRVLDLARVLFSNDALHSDGIHSEAKTQALREIQCFSSRHRSHISEALSGFHVKSILPCTPLQEGIIAKMLADDSHRPQYLNLFVFKLDEGIDLEKLTEAWAVLHRRLDILRTYFVPTEDGFSQVIIRPSETWAVQTIQCSSTEDGVSKSIDSVYKEWQHQARQLVDNASWTVKLIRHHVNKESYMVFLMFHALYDGVSLPLLLRQLHKVYEGGATAFESQPSFHDLLAQGALLAKADARLFWQQNYQSHPIANLQTGGHSRQVQKVVRKVRLPALSSIVTSLGVSYQAVFQGIWSLCLTKLFKKRLCIGTVVSGRAIDVDDADKIIGPMFNTIPLCVREMSAESTLSDLVKAYHKFNVDALPYQHTPLSSIKKWWSIYSKQQLFDSLFVYQSRARSKSPPPWRKIMSEAVADYPLSVEIEQDDQIYHITIVAQDLVGYPDLPQTLAGLLTPSLLNLRDELSREVPPSVFGSVPVNPTQDAGSNLVRSNGVADEKLSTIQAEIQKQIADIASAPVAAIRLHTPTLFELGLDSIDALKLVARLKRANLSIKVSKVLQNATLAGISAHCDLVVQANALTKMPYEKEQSVWKSTLEQYASGSSDVETILPVTPMQEGLLLEYEQYFRVFVYELAPSVNTDDFVRAVNDTRRHLPILRTRFALLEPNDKHAQFLQVIERSASQTVNCSTRLMTSMDDLKSYVRQRYDDAVIEASIPCCECISISDTCTRFFVLSMSHAHFDAWSLEAIHKEIMARYETKIIRDAELFEIGQFIKRARDTSESRSSTDFWTKVTRGLRATNITPTSDANASFTLRYASRLPQSVFTEACKHYGVTLQSICLTAWSLTLICLTQQLDVCFGMVVSGRTDATTEHLVFPTFNTVLCRPRLDPEHNVRNMLQYVQRTSNEMLEHQYFPLSSATKLAGKNAFNTLFTFQRPTDTQDESMLYNEYELETTSPSPPYAVNLEIQPTSKNLTWTIATQENIVSAKQGYHIVKLLDRVLGGLVSLSAEHALRLHASKLTVLNLASVDLEHQAHALKTGNGDLSLRPWSQTELNVRQIFSEISGVDISEINHNTDIFSLGLDSISAIRISGALKKVNLKAPVSLLLRHQSVVNISAALTTYATIEVDTAPYDTKHAARTVLLLEPTLKQNEVPLNQVEAVRPATAGQVYMLDMYAASQGRLHYNEFWFEVEMSKLPDLESAFLALTRTIPMLRTAFIQHDRRMYQVLFKAGMGVAQYVPWQYEIVHTTEFNPTSVLVALKIHHALYDAVSIALLRTALAVACTTDAKQVKTSHDIQPFLTQTEPDTEAAVTARKEFWNTYLAPALPNSSVWTVGTYSSLRATKFEPKLLPAKPLQAFARTHSFTVQSLLFAVVARLYGNFLHNRTTGYVVIGIYLANRSLDIDKLDTLIAPTISVVPLRVNTGVNSDRSLVEIAQEIQTDLAEVSQAQYCNINLRDIYAWTGIKIDCYINFVRIPESGSSSSGSTKSFASGSEDVIVRPTTARPHLLNPSSSKRALPTPAPVINADQVSSDDMAWCLPSLDIEARLDEHGWLQTGIFVPRDKLDEPGVANLMTELKDTLKEVCKLDEEEWEREVRALHNAK